VSTIILMLPAKIESTLTAFQASDVGANQLINIVL
jgi:hypothetical protein